MKPRFYLFRRKDEYTESMIWKWKWKTYRNQEWPEVQWLSWWTYWWPLRDILLVLHTCQCFPSLLRFQELQKLFPNSNNSLPISKPIKWCSILCDLLYNPFDINLFSVLFILDLGRLEAFIWPLLDNNVLVTSCQSRYIMYGSSNLTLKKNEEPGLYGGAVWSFPFPLFDVGGSVMCVWTTNPSTGFLFHSPVLAQVFVKSLTSWMLLRIKVGVWMKPHSSAKASTSSVESVLNSLEHTLRLCKWRPVSSGGYLRTCSLKDHHITRM